MSEERFSLKEHLFNKKKVELLSSQILSVYPEFAAKKFETVILKAFPNLELMERVYLIRDQLIEQLPSEYEKALQVILNALPEPLDTTLTDDDFGDFIYLPYGFFVVEQGMEKQNLKHSLNALKEITQRFSMEGPIRFFLNEYPEETMSALASWAKDKNYHVRRLVSEGTRPSLPWAKKLHLPYEGMFPFLNTLHADKTRYVTRSVANHLNDISKLDPDLVIKTLKEWKQEGKQDEKELDFMTRHALRTLVKQGNADALELLGYGTKNISVSDIELHTPKVQIGEALEFSFSISSKAKESQQLMIDYVLYFMKANGELAPKTFKIAKCELEAGESQTFSKRQPLRKMTTRKLYPGKHRFELQINGQRFGSAEFVLK